MIGRPHVHHRLTDSTNEQAKRLAAGGAPHGTLVSADEQQAGRGRQGRSWSAAPGRALLISLVLRDLEERHALLPLAAAVAVCEACEQVASVDCAIKWPNDVWIERRKICGILIEGRPQEGWAVLGIGINISTALDEFPAELRETATSLAVAGGRAPSRDELLAVLLKRLDGLLEQPADSVLAAWRERDVLRGEPVAWSGGAGTAAGIADSGALLVELDAGLVELDAGEVHLERL